MSVSTLSREAGGIVVAKPERHAVVLGGSIAGLLAARVLLDHFDRVTLIERDQFPDQPATRPGVPQGQHVHGLLLQGQQILEQLFPGLTQALIADGAISLDWIADWKFFSMEGWLEQHDSGLQGLCCSRLLVEWYLRQRLLEQEHFQLRPGCYAKQLLTDETDAIAVTGVVVNEEAGTTEIAADLVVDATGRNSKLPQWLAELGYEKPPESRVNSFLGYSSRWYECSSEDKAQGVIIAAKPGESKRGGVIYPVEKGRWIVTLSGIAGDHPPGDEAGFMAFAQSLRDPMIYDILKTAQPASPIHCYRRTENQWRHYEKLPAMPRGVVAFGDAVCCFNPVYGQGMTAAALGAITLQKSLAKARTEQQAKHWEAQFQQRLSKQLQTPWLMSTGEDFRWSETEGERPGWLSQQFQGYVDRILQLSVSSPKVHRAFLEVAHLVKSPMALFNPQFVWQVLTLPRPE